MKKLVEDNVHRNYSFYSMATRLKRNWNDLPNAISSTTDITAFKNLAKNHLLHLY